MLKRAILGVITILLVLLVVSASAIGAEKTVMVSGTVFLPEGEVAPAGGVRVQVLNGLGDGAIVRIEQGKNSTIYSYATKAGMQQNVRYLISQADYAGAEYIRQGYYAGSTTTQYLDRALTITPGSTDLGGINLYISRGITVSGTINLPQGYTAPSEGTSVQVGTTGGWVNVVIPAGKSSVEYALTVVPGMYKIGFVSFSDSRFVREVYYHESRAMFSAGTGSWVNARQEPVKGVNIELIRSASLTIITVIGERGYMANGKSFDSNPVTYNANKDTYMPLRMLEALGAIVEWDDKTNTATLTYGDKKVLLVIGATHANVNGQSVAIIGASGKAAPAVITSGRTMIPSRFISESLGLLVQWVAPSYLVITTP